MSTPLLFPRSPERIAIVSGLRTPFVRQATVFASLPAIELGAMVVGQLLRETAISPSQIDQIVFGQVIQMPSAPNIAREIGLATSLGVATDAYSVSRACTTGFTSVMNVAQSIMSGNIEIGIAGGADSSSVLPIGSSRKLAAGLLALKKSRSLWQKLRISSRLSWRDLLPVAPAIAEYSTGLSMGDTAEQMAKTFAISRQSQDDFAHLSHQRAAAAWRNGGLSDEVMTAFPEPYQNWIAQDNTVRMDSIRENYQPLPPIFDKEYGSVTAGNSSPLTDGAAAVLMMKESKARELGLAPLGYLRSAAFSANQVTENMLLGPAFSAPLALEQAGLSLKDLAFTEMHEAFAAQVLANVELFSSKRFAQKTLQRRHALGEIEMDKLNPLGGSIAYGHPFAATGIRMLVQSLRELKRRGGGFALTTACAAGGLGAAFVLEVNND